MNYLLFLLLSFFQITNLASYHTFDSNFFVKKNNSTHEITAVDNTSIQTQVLGTNITNTNFPTITNGISVENIIYYTNEERIKRELEPLQPNRSLNASAKMKLGDMIRYSYFAHESPLSSEKNFAYFIDQQNYSFIRVSENLAKGEFSTAKEVVTAWMNSTGHRANILYPHYEDIGIAIETKNDGSVIIVQHFGVPKNLCPEVSDNLVQRIQSVSREASTLKKKSLELRNEIERAENSEAQESLVYELIDIYNDTIYKYNSLTTLFEEITDEYNRKVKAYNNCISQI